jgi:sugar lactone lactonase YvrE
MTRSACVVLLAVALLGCPPGGDECLTSGTGDIAVDFAGLPGGVTGRVTLRGPSTQVVTSPQTLTGLGAGTWTVEADKAVAADPRVRTVYAPAVSTASLCLEDQATTTVTVTWAEIPTSHKLWVLNTNGTGDILGYASALLGATTTTAPTVNADAGGGKDIAFDKDGNLWALGPTLAEPHVVRFSASSFSASGTRTRDRGIDIAGLGCLPAMAGLAFDPAGNLWVTSACGDRAMKLPASSLGSTSTVEVTPASTAAGIDGAQGIAFDSSGNLWVASPSDLRLMRFDAAALGAVDVGAPALTIGARVSDTVGNDALFNPGWLAFDAAGNLWSNDFGGNVIFRIPAAELTGTGDKDVNPAVRITLAVSALIEGMAFDEGGGLWTALSSGKFGRLGPTQLDTSTGAGAPTAPETVITSADIGSAVNLAFYPAPASLPLFHGLPE